MRVTARVPLDLEPAEVDLGRWVIGLDEADYRSFSQGHQRFAIDTRDGEPIIVGVETVGGHMVLNRYRVERLAPHAMRVRSPDSRCYLLRLFPVRMQVIWEMGLLHREQGGSWLECTLDSSFASPVLRALADRLAKRTLQRHANEETPLFAFDIKRKSEAHSATVQANASGAAQPDRASAA